MLSPSPPGALRISVVVPSHDRPVRLRWLLNDLSDQTLEPGSFEVVVVHDTADPAVEEMLAQHELSATGVLRHRHVEPGTGTPSRQRNVGWRMAAAPLVAFTDDDCRPAPDWLERLLAAARRHPGAIVQGATRPDPYEQDVFAAPHTRSLSVDPPGPYGQTCNILYPRDALVAAGGFDEAMPAPAGEDTDLLIRVRGTGVPLVGAPDAVVFHAVESFSLLGMMRLSLKWQHVAYVVKRHPEIRRQFRWRLFWRPEHASLLLALAGVAVMPRARAGAGLALPYVVGRLPRTTNPRHLLRRVTEAPGQLLIELSEVAAMLAGSVRYRTVVL